MVDKLRVVAWNCNGSFHNKYSALAVLQPDIAMISEAYANFNDGLGVSTSSSLWLGAKGKSGLGVLALNGWTLEPVDIAVAQRLFLPFVACRGSHQVHMVAVCTKKSTDYVTPTLAALRDLSGFIQASPTIIAGDFNGSVAFDPNRPVPFRRVIDDLARLNIRSAWHTFRNERFGGETTPTYYMYRREGRPFHIDYAFVSDAFEVEDINIGGHAEWCQLSDHTPISVDLRLPSR